MPTKLDANQAIELVTNEAASSFYVSPAIGSVFPISGTFSADGSNVAVTSIVPIAISGTSSVSGSALTASIAGTANVSVVNTAAVSGAALTATIAGTANVSVSNTVAVSGSVSTSNVYLTVVDLLDGDLLPASGIHSSTGSFSTVVTSLAAAVKYVYIADTIGEYAYLITSSTTAVINPGMNQELEFIAASGAAVCAKYAQNVSPTAGYLTVNFIG